MASRGTPTGCASGDKLILWLFSQGGNQRLASSTGALYLCYEDPALDRRGRAVAGAKFWRRRSFLYERSDRDHERTPEARPRFLLGPDLEPDLHVARPSAGLFAPI